MAAQWAGGFSRRVSSLTAAAQCVTDVKEHPTHIILADFAARLESLASSLTALQGELEVNSTGSSKPQQRDMEAEVAAAEHLVAAHKAKCALSLLLSCPLLLMKLQSCRGNLSKALELIIPEACSLRVKVQVSQTRQQLEEGGPKLGVREQAMIDGLGMVTHGLTPSKGAELVEQVAECLGISLGSDAFAHHLAEAKQERARAEISDDDAYAVYMDDCLMELEKALEFRSQPVAAARNPDESLFVPPSPRPNRRAKGLAVVAPSSPLPSFVCPITKQVMQDPVQIVSGKTYERAAIERWFQDGKTTCPLGGEKLKNTKMKSNFALRQSITEWRERNYAIRLDNAEWRLRSFQPIEQVRGARDVRALCEEEPLNKYAIASRKMIPLLIRLAEASPLIQLREVSFDALSALAQDHRENQEFLVKEGVIDVLVQCLRNYDEAQPAVSLLKVLSSNPEIAESISRTPDAVLLLVTFLGHKNEGLVFLVKAVLVNLPTTDENVVIMAEANLMKPLVTRLVEGGTESKVLMAKTLARLEHMPDESRSLASTRDSIFTLTNMTNSAREEEVYAAIGAVRNLSRVASVCTLIASCSGLEVLIRLLASEKTSPSTKTGAAQLVANVLIALGDEWAPSNDRDTDLDSFIETLLVVVAGGAGTLPAVQSHLLQGLRGLGKGKCTGKVAKAKMMQRDAFSVLVPLLRADPQPAGDVRRDAVRMFSCLSGAYREEACRVLKSHAGTLLVLAEILRGEETSQAEKVAVAKIISHLPPDDGVVTNTLLGAGVVPILVEYLDTKDEAMQEAAAGALARFTLPSSLELQKRIAEMGVLPKFVSLLDAGRPLMKATAARALANFSASTPQLVRPAAPPPRRWCQCVSPEPDACRLHGGTCAVESTFCLLEADAVGPLLAIVAEGGRGGGDAAAKLAEVALAALYTLVDGAHWERGCGVIKQAGGIPVVINSLPTGTRLGQEVAVNMCEKFFRLPENRELFGVSAQMHIITLAQQGAPKTKDVAGQILRQLDLLHTQSHYFGYHSTTK